MAGPFDAEAVRRRLRSAWSARSSGKWRADAPALGQCSVTALLLRDRYGAEILSTPTPWGPHFYNRVGGERLDRLFVTSAGDGVDEPHGGDLFEVDPGVTGLPPHAFGQQGE